MSIRLDTVPALDRQTDRQTDRFAITILRSARRKPPENRRIGGPQNFTASPVFTALSQLATFAM